MANTAQNAGAVSMAVFVLSLTAVIFYLKTQEEKKNMPNVCETVECIDEAARILNAMDRTADPCENFSQFACGGWVKNNPIPESRGSQSQFNLAEDENKKVLKRILSSDHTDDRDAIKKAKIYYKGCVNEEQLDQMDALPAIDLIGTLGGFPLFGDKFDEKDFNLEDFLARASAIASPIVSMYTYIDAQNSSRYLTHVDQPSLLMPDREYYLSDEFNSTQLVFRNFLRKFLGMLWKRQNEIKSTTTFDAEKLDIAVDQIYQLEKDLAEIIIPKENLFDIAEMYKNFTLAEMPITLTPNFDWSRYINGIFSKIDKKINKNVEVGTVTMPYLSKMTSVLSKYSSRIIQNYIVVFSLFGKIVLMSKKFRDTLSEYRKVTTGATSEEPRWKVCLTKSVRSLPMAVGATYVAVAFSEKSRKNVLDMTDLIFESFENGLDTIDWMDNETAKAAKAKVANILPLMVYPQYIVDENNTRLDEEYKYAELNESEFYKAQLSLYHNSKIRELKRLEKPVDKEMWGMSPAEVNAYYEDSRNVMVFPAGIFQPPFFSAGSPYAANFGGIGEVVAHELTHGFDKIGADYDENANLNNWWTNASRMNFEEAEKCFIEQYNSYFYEKAGKFLNGKLTVAENVADNGAVRHAFYAYQMWKERNPGKEFSLPGLEKYTTEQMFFISYAQNNCEAETAESAVRRITEAYHNFGPYRTIGALHNFGVFGETFQCKQGVDKMYRKNEDVCSLW